MKKITSVFVLFTMCVAPLFASAQSTTDIQAQAQALLQKVQQLQSQIGSAGASSSTGSTSDGSCPNVGRVLKLGSSGDDVTRLQQFLAQDTGVYPEGIVSGYYGSLTVAAVQRWQTKYNVVSSGTPDTTGYGIVGPRTAAAIALLCSQGGGGGSSGPVVGGYIQVTPVTGTAPLGVGVTAYANSALSCAAVNYTLDFGDGSPVQTLAVPSGSCQQISQRYSHTYIYGGRYTITFAAAGHKTTAIVVINGPAAPVVPGGTGYNPNPNLPQQYNNTLSVSPVSGTAPVTITISAQSLDPSVQYTIDFGDGSTALLSGGIAGQQVTHVYNNSGSFTVKLISNGGTVIRTQNVSIGSGSGGSTSSYTIISVTPTTSSNQVSIQLSVPACPTYTVNWGDGASTSGVPPSGCSASSGAITPTLSHTYGSAGTYNITLADSTHNTQSTASITISN